MTKAVYVGRLAIAPELDFVLYFDRTAIHSGRDQKLKGFFLMDLIFSVVALWLAGGVLFIQTIITNPNAGRAVAANSHAVVDDLIRLRPAALVAAALFLLVWPAVWIGAHLVRR